MARYRYKAVAASGETVEGEMEAGSEEDVLQRLHVEGYIPIRAVAQSGRRMRQGTRLRGYAGGRVTRADVERLTQDLGMLIQAGFSTDGALKMQREMADKPSLHRLLERIHDRVREGASLSAAMEAQGTVFSPLYLNMVRAGETAGALSEALHRLGNFMERSREIRETIVSAMIYPVILVAVAVVSLTLILAVVIPRFTDMFEQAGQALPLPTRIVVGASTFLQHYWWLLFLVLVAAAWYLRRQFHNPATRIKWDARLLRLPVAGGLLQNLETARFSRTMGTLTGNGIPLVKAVDIARAGITNRAIAAAMDRVADRISQGQGLARPLLEERVVPGLAVHMLRVAEESGRMAEMLIRVADHYDRELQASVRRLVALIEPVLILGLGLMIGGIIMSIVVAIVNVNQLSGL